MIYLDLDEFLYLEQIGDNRRFTNQAGLTRGKFKPPFPADESM